MPPFELSEDDYEGCTQPSKAELEWKPQRITLKRPEHYDAKSWSTILAHPTTRYARDVLEGKYVTGIPVKWACERHLLDLQRDEFIFDPSRADRAFLFLESLAHHEGDWNSKTLDLEPWQHFVVGSTHGWHIYDERGRYVRRFRAAYVQIARKNGKTYLGSGLSLLALAADGEQGAKVYSVATKKDQAKLAWEGARAIAELTPALKEALTMRVSRTIYPQTFSYFAYLGRDSKTEDGLNPHFVLVDELHAHQTSEMVNVMRSAIGARSQPLFYYITTAGLRGGYGRQQYEMYRKIVDPANPMQDETAFVFIAEPDGWLQLTGRESAEEIRRKGADDPDSPRTWLKANPNLGVSVSVQSLRDDIVKAQNDESYRSEAYTKRLNIWLSSTTGWLSPAVFESNIGDVPFDALPDFIASLRRPSFLGMDLSKNEDLSSVALYCPPIEEATGEVFEEENPETGEVDIVEGYELVEPGYARVWSWCPEKQIEERTLKGVPYREFEEAGSLIATPGPVVNYRYIANHVFKLAREQWVEEMGYDPFFANQIALDMLAEGLEMVEVPQNFRTMDAAVGELKRVLLLEALHHGNCPLLSWSFGNLMVTRDANNNHKFDKGRSPEKIDPWVALAIAVQRAISYEGPALSSTEARGGAVELNI